VDANARAIRHGQAAGMASLNATPAQPCSPKAAVLEQSAAQAAQAQAAGRAAAAAASDLAASAAGWTSAATAVPVGGATAASSNSRSPAATIASFKAWQLPSQEEQQQQQQRVLMAGEAAGAVPCVAVSRTADLISLDSQCLDDASLAAAVLP
jgi:hypothetical protein